jgi:hypothetical protein
MLSEGQTTLGLEIKEVRLCGQMFRAIIKSHYWFVMTMKLLILAAL